MPGRKCPPGCTCGLHSPERRERLRQIAKEQAQREGPAQRSAQVKQVWANRSEAERKDITDKIVRKLRGKRWSPDIVAKRAEAMRKTWAERTPEARRAQVEHALAARSRSMTELEVAVAAALDVLGITYRFEAPVGAYYVDFLIDNSNLLIEVDGTYWHQDTERDTQRDDALRALGYEVIHLDEAAIKDDPLKAVGRSLLLWGTRRGV